MAKITIAQQMAQAAFVACQNLDSDAAVFAQSFPTFLQDCGLAQAIAFAKNKSKEYYATLEKVVQKSEGNIDLDEKAREAGLIDYMRLTKRTQEAAAWIKRYAKEKRGENNGSID